MRLQRIVDSWNGFWFTPQSPTPIALFRIIFGLIMFFHALCMFPDRFLWFHDSGFLKLETVRQYAIFPGQINLFYLLPPGKEWVTIYLIAVMGVALLVTFGFFTRGSCILLWLMIFSMNKRCPIINNSGFMVAQVCAFWLIFTEAGSAMSLDRLWRVARGRETEEVPRCPPWGQRLVQVQLAILYLHAVLSKMGNPQWLTGTAGYYVVRMEHWQRLLPLPLFEYIWVTRLMTWGTLLIEFSLATLIWIVEFRYVVLLAGVGLHLSMEILMNLHLFQWVTMAPYVSFIEPEHLRLVMDRIRSGLNDRFGPPRPVFYDGSCEACMRTVRMVRVLDFLHRFQMVNVRSSAELVNWPHFTEEQAKRSERELLLLLPHGDWLGGFDAFRRMTWSLPLLWPTTPFLYLPGISVVGRHLYRWFSRNRFRILGVHCSGLSCLP